MKNKELFLILSIFIFCIFLISFVSSVEMLTSDAGIKYDQRILDEFANPNNTIIINDSTNESYVQVLIYFKEPLEVDNFVFTFSNEEIKDTSDNNLSSSRITARITKKGFDKLINDERVDKVYYDFPFHGFEKNNSLNQIILIVVIIVLILSILVFYIIKRLIKIKKR